MYLLEIGSQSLLFHSKEHALNAVGAVVGGTPISRTYEDSEPYKRDKFYALRLTEVPDDCYNLDDPTVSNNVVPY